MSDLAAILESNVLTYIRVLGIFLIGSVALFNFSSWGKSFSLIALIIALLLSIALVVDYFVERYRIARLGFFPRKIVDILMFIMIGVIVLIVWIIFSVYHTEPISLTSLAREIEDKIEEVNRSNLAYLQALSGHPPDSKFIFTHGKSSIPTKLASFERQRNMVNIAALAVTA